MAYGNTASDIMGQDGGHRSSPTCPPGAAELSFDREVKTEERDSFTSSAEVWETRGWEGHSKASLSMPT